MDSTLWMIDILLASRTVEALTSPSTKENPTADTKDDRLVYIVVDAGGGQIGFILMTILACVKIWYKKGKTNGVAGNRGCVTEARARTPKRSGSRYSMTSNMRTGGTTTESIYIDIVPGSRQNENDNLNEEQGKNLLELRTDLCCLENASTQKDNRIGNLGIGKGSTRSDIGLLELGIERPFIGEDIGTRLEMEMPTCRSYKDSRLVLRNENVSTPNEGALPFRGGNTSTRDGCGLASGSVGVAVILGCDVISLGHEKASTPEDKRVPLAFVSGNVTTRGHSEVDWEYGEQPDINWNRILRFLMDYHPNESTQR